MGIIVYCIVAALFVFILWRWETISLLIESRQPDYEYINYLERKVLEPTVPGEHSFYGLKPGMSYILDVLTCRQCELAGEDKPEVYPCYQHVTLFSD